MKPDLIAELTATGDKGINIHDLAKEVYLLSEELKIPVSFIFNEQEYTVKLIIEAKKKP